MEKWTDPTGSDWLLKITVADVRRIRDCTGFDLSKMFTEGCPGIDELFDDIVLVVDVLFCLCESQAEKRNIDGEQFAKLMYGDWLSSACEALMRAIVNFFPSQSEGDRQSELATMPQAAQGTAQSSNVYVSPASSGSPRGTSPCGSSR